MFVERFHLIGQRFVFLHPTDRGFDLGKGSEGRKVGGGRGIISSLTISSSRGVLILGF